MPTYPSGGPQVTVDIMLKQPKLLARRLSDLTYNRYVADRILMKGSPDSVEGGVARFQRAESIFTDRPAETTAGRTEFPRASWSEDILTAVVQQHGLEVPINGLSIRRNQIDQVQRALVKLSNSIVDYVDGLAMTMILTDASVGTFAGAAWTTAGRVFTDVGNALKVIRENNQGYNPDTLLINEATHLTLMSDLQLQASMPRESQVNPWMTGKVAPFLGLSQVLITNKIPSGKAIVCEAGMLGTIADEAVDPSEGYSTYTPQVGPSISTMVYDEVKFSDKIVRGARWPAMWIAEPGAAQIITSI